MDTAPADSPEQPDPSDYGSVIERFAPPAANVVGVGIFAVILLAGGIALAGFFLREAAVMPGNIGMRDGTMTDRLVRGVLPSALGFALIGFGIGLARFVGKLRKQWVEVRQGGLYHGTAAGVRKLPWRMVVAFHEQQNHTQFAGVSSTGVGVEVHVKRGENVSYTSDSVQKIKRLIRILREAATREGIEWHVTVLDMR